MNVKSLRTLPAVLALALCAFAARPQSDLTRLDGRITKEGKSLVGARVVLSQQETLMAFRATTDKYGTFSISDVPRGNYLVSILNAADDVLFRKVLSLSSAPDAPIRLDIEISPSFAAPSTAAPAYPSASEARTAASAPENPKDSELDALNRRYIAAQRAGDQKEVIASLKALVAADPTRWDYFEALGDAQLGLGDYENAAESYAKGVEAGQQFLSTARSNDPGILKSDRDRTKAGVAQLLISQGNALLKLKKNSEAIAAYKKAAEMGANPAMAYFNLCVAHYNTKILDGAVDACDKAIAADPTRADAFFIKGAMLFSSGKQEKNGRIIAPPGTVEALRKYLELAPQGAEATSARQMLEYIRGSPESPDKSGRRP